MAACALSPALRQVAASLNSSSTALTVVCRFWAVDLAADLSARFHAADTTGSDYCIKISWMFDIRALGGGNRCGPAAVLSAVPATPPSLLAARYEVCLTINLAVALVFAAVVLCVRARARDAFLVPWAC